MAPGDDGFHQYKELLIYRADRTDQKIDALSGQVTELKADVAALQVKSSVLGVFAGAVGASIVSALKWLK